MHVHSSTFGHVGNTKVWLFSLMGRDNSMLSLTNYGARLTSLRMLDGEGRMQELILGYDSLEPYLDDKAYLGATVGRVANRIRKGEFLMEGHTYQLPRNEGQHHLHGGPGGFHQAFWEAEPYQAVDHAGVRFFLVSKDGEEGYPGRLQVEVDISFRDDDTLQFSYKAESDRVTPLNLTNHTYWILGNTPAIGSHYLQVMADRTVAVDEDMLPTGDLPLVAEGPLDFRSWQLLDERIAALVSSHTKGLDHCFVLNQDARMPKPAAKLYAPDTGREMLVSTTMPGLQVYTANRLSGTLSRYGSPRQSHSSICLETQYFPDSVNMSHFPSTLLTPGEQYVHQTRHQFIAGVPFQNRKIADEESFSLVC